MSVRDPGEEMHSLLAKELLLLLKNSVACKTCGRGTLKVQELTVIRQFLSDNGIKGDLSPVPQHAPVENPLTDRLPFGDPEAPRTLKPNE